VFWGYFLVSLFLTAFGQSQWVPGCGALAASFGIALFWRSMLLIQGRKKQFFLSSFWFAAVQSVQLSWMASTDYMGPLIFAVYFFLCIAIGCQFGLLSLFLVRCLQDSGKRVWISWMAIGGVWVWMEWSRQFFLSGFTWNPIGFALADLTPSLQMASLCGIYGLSFWVIVTNLAALRLLVARKGRHAAIWAVFALFPYLFGWGYQVAGEKKSGPLSFSAALVQTALLPEQKEFFSDRPEVCIAPLDQWERVFRFFDRGKKIDLIVLPEAAFPYGAYRLRYPLEYVKTIWEIHFGRGSAADFPPLAAPYARFFEEMDFWKVNNAFLAQALSNHFQAHVIIGLDDQDVSAGEKYNAAFHFYPEGKSPERYEKRVLVPVSEYIPFQGWKGLSNYIVSEFGIDDSFNPGKEAKIFNASVPVGVSICVEETYSGLVRDLRLKGAEMFVNVSNDVWFPGSRLPQHHFQHARVRSVENGVPALRCCNTGVTGGIDCFGRPTDLLLASEKQAGILYLDFPKQSIQTLYTLWGDGAILGIGLASFVFFLFPKRKKKLP